MIWDTDPAASTTGELTFSSTGLPIIGRLVRSVDAAPCQPRRPEPVGPREGSDPLDRRTVRVLAEARETAAGVFFAPHPASAPLLPAAPEAYLVVHVRVVEAGFEVAGRSLPPSALARAIRWTPTWRHRPVVVIPVGPPPAGRPLAQIMAELATALGVFVITSCSGVYQGRQILITGGSFLRWPAAPASDDRTSFEHLGPVLPVLGEAASA